MGFITRMAVSASLFSPLVFASIADADPGYRTASIEVAHRDQPLQLHIWYPGGNDGVSMELGRNAVFKGTRVRVGARPQSGKFPLVVLSHGSGGNAVNIGWIASHLAEQGIIVVATNHPGTTSRDSIPHETVKIWQRPADLSAMLDYFEATPPGPLVPDMERVGAVGFSLGGYSVLALAGAQVSKQLYIDYCAAMPEMWDCQWFRQAGVDLSKTNAALFDRNNRDGRVKSVVAIDPGLAQAFVSNSLAQVRTPIQIINLGQAEDVPAAINGKHIAAAIGGATHTNVTGSAHFSFLGECTDKGEAIIRREGEEPICSEYHGRRRSDIHEELKGLIEAFLKNHL